MILIIWSQILNLIPCHLSPRPAENLEISAIIQGLQSLDSPYSLVQKRLCSRDHLANVPPVFRFQSTLHERK